MTLSIQRSDRRDRRLCRFGVMLVVCSLVINMVAVPKAKAVVTETAALGAAATVCVVDYSTAMMVFSGMKTGAATSSVIGLMDTYAAATGVAASGTALASTIATGILVAGGTLLVGAAAAALIGGFIDWMREQDGMEAGGESLTVGGVDSGIRLYNGFAFPDVDSVWIDKETYPYAFLLDGGSYGYYLWICTDVLCRIKEGSYRALSYSLEYLKYKLVDDSWDYQTVSSLAYLDTTSLIFWTSYDLCNEDGTVHLTGNNPSSVYEEGTGILVVPKPEFQEIPNEIPEGQVLSIDTGLTTLPQDDPQAIADAIMQSAIDGALAPTVSVEADPSVQPDPDPEPDPNPDPELPSDAPELPSNLGDLGKALTTRFPFSIPWDIAKAVKLLAAPAKAPYWEIDFIEPIRYRFSDLGDTTITIDLGKPEYEIIGITTRLTSTIGFCLALAAATKRFIWTA